MVGVGGCLVVYICIYGGSGVGVHDGMGIVMPLKYSRLFHIRTYCTSWVIVQCRVPFRWASVLRGGECYGPTNKARGSCVTAVVNLSCRVLSAVNGLAYKRLGFGHRLSRSLLQTSALPE